MAPVAEAEAEVVAALVVVAEPAEAEDFDVVVLPDVLTLDVGEADDAEVPATVLLLVTVTASSELALLQADTTREAEIAAATAAYLVRVLHDRRAIKILQVYVR
jgi:hypothetical protein